MCACEKKTPFCTLFIVYLFVFLFYLSIFISLQIFYPLQSNIDPSDRFFPRRIKKNFEMAHYELTKTQTAVNRSCQNQQYQTKYINYAQINFNKKIYEKQ